MLHIEVSRLWSRGVIQLFSDSRAQYDQKSNSMTKFGEYLKAGDRIFRNADAQGRSSKDPHCWRVVELLYTEGLSIDALRVGQNYGIFVRDKRAVQSFKLESVDLESKVRPRTMCAMFKASPTDLSADVPLPVSLPWNRRYRGERERSSLCISPGNPDECPCYSKGYNSGEC